MDSSGHTGTVTHIWKTGQIQQKKSVWGTYVHANQLKVI